jgi:hypothetical protein
MQTSQSLNLVRAGYSLSVRNSLAAEVQPLSGDAKGSGSVSLPNGYRPKFRTRPKNGIGSRCFPATGHYVDRSTGENRRQHIHETALQRRLRSRP